MPVVLRLLEGKQVTLHNSLHILIVNNIEWGFNVWYLLALYFGNLMRLVSIQSDIEDVEIAYTLQIKNKFTEQSEAKK